MADHYEYKGLSEKAKEAAKEKLKENPAEVNEHIENFRNLLKSKPHLTCPMDSSFLLKFLRVAKFDYKKAESKIDNFCTLKSSIRGAPEYFDNINVDDPMVDEYLEKALLIPLGRNEAEELIVLIRYNTWDPETIPFKWFITFFIMSLDIMAEEEETQIYGIRIVHDLTDMPRRAFAEFSDSKILTNLTRLLYGSNVYRLKGEIFYNYPEIFNINYQMYTFFMKEKKKNQTLQVKGNKIEDLMAKIPGIEKLMPAEYGGQAGPISEIAEEWTKRFKDYYKSGNPKSCACTDESKRPDETLCYLKDYGDYEGPTITKE